MHIVGRSMNALYASFKEAAFRFSGASIQFSSIVNHLDVLVVQNTLPTPIPNPQKAVAGISRRIYDGHPGRPSRYEREPSSVVDSQRGNVAVAPSTHHNASSVARLQSGEQGKKIYPADISSTYETDSSISSHKRDRVERFNFARVPIKYAREPLRGPNFQRMDRSERSDPAKMPSRLEEQPHFLSNLHRGRSTGNQDHATGGFENEPPASPIFHRGETTRRSNQAHTASPEGAPDAFVDGFKYPQRLEGEKRWQFAVRKKRLLAGHSRGKTKKLTEVFSDDEALGVEPMGEEWRRKKLGWLCKQIPKLKPKQTVTILNDQRNWIDAVDTKLIVKHLVRINQFLRAHRVLKWEMQQPWYVYDFDLNSQVADLLGENNKLSRTRDLYNLMIKNGRIPPLSTYIVLIKCYIADAENESLREAWALYNQLSQLGGYEPPPTLLYNLFQAFLPRGIQYLEKADEVFKNIRAAGLVASQEMYDALVQLHGTMGNHDRVDALIQDMKDIGLPLSLAMYSAVLRACSKDGNVSKGEQAFKELKKAGFQPHQAVYASLVKMYGKAGAPEKAFDVLQEMTSSGVNPGITVYEPVIEVLANFGYQDLAEKLLADAYARGLPSLTACYNSLLDLYLKKGLVAEGERLFTEMQQKNCHPNVASYNLLISLYLDNGRLENAEKVYEGMSGEGRVHPNKRSYELMIEGYGKARNGRKVKEVFEQLASRKFDVPDTVTQYLERSVSPKKVEAQKMLNLKLDKEQREILVGVLLGGARIESHDRNRTYEIHFGLEASNDRLVQLLKHLYEKFSIWSKEVPQSQAWPGSSESTKTKKLLGFQTVSHGCFRFFAHQYRPDGVPKIPRLIHRWLSPRALAYWFMYAGGKCTSTGKITLNAYFYTDKEIDLVVKSLEGRTIECERKTTNQGSIIVCNGQSAEWLWKLIEPHVLPLVVSTVGRS